MFLAVLKIETFIVPGHEQGNEQGNELKTKRQNCWNSHCQVAGGAFVELRTSEEIATEQSSLGGTALHSD